MKNKNHNSEAKPDRSQREMNSCALTNYSLSGHSIEFIFSFFKEDANIKKIAFLHYK